MKIIRMTSDFEAERNSNIKQLKALIDKYTPENKKFVTDKIKKEQ